MVALASFGAAAFAAGFAVWWWFGEYWRQWREARRR